MLFFREPCCGGCGEGDGDREEPGWDRAAGPGEGRAGEPRFCDSGGGWGAASTHGPGWWA